MASNEKEIQKQDRKDDIEDAHQYLLNMGATVSPIGSSDLKVQGGLFLAAVIIFVGAKVFHIEIAQALASAGADLILAMLASAYHAWSRTHKPVQAPIEGTKSANPTK